VIGIVVPSGESGGNYSFLVGLYLVDSNIRVLALKNY